MRRSLTNLFALGIFQVLLLATPFAVSGQTVVDSLKQVLQKLPEDTLRVKSNLVLYEELRYEQPDEAIVYLLKARELSDKLTYETGILKSNLLLGDHLEMNSSYDSALAVFRWVEHLAMAAKSRTFTLEALSGQSKTLRSMSEWEQAIKIIERCIALAQETPIDSAAIADNYNHLGNIYSDQNQFEKAIDFYLKCVPYLQQQQQRKAIVTMNIGLIHYRLENDEKAAEYFFKSLEIAKKIDAKLVMAHGYQKIGMVKRVMGELEEAKRYYLQAIEMFKLIYDRSMLAYVRSNLAAIYSDEKDFDASIKEFLLSLSIQEEISDKVGQCYTLNSLGLAFTDQGNLPKAIDYFLKAKAAAIEVGVLLVNKDACENLSNIYAELGDFEKAYNYHTEFKLLNDSTFNEAKTSRIAELEEKYQNEQKQQEINLLSAENQIATLELQKQQDLRNYLIIAAFLLVLLIGVVYSRYQVKARANAKLRELDHLKTNFFTNISHELRTPLTLIISPIQRLLQQNKDRDSQKSLQMIHYNASKLTELINQLLDLSKLEAGKLSLQVSSGNLQGMLKIAAASFESLAEIQKIELRLAVEQAPRQAFFDEGKLQQILNNLLSNAFKFTPEGGYISLTASLKEDTIHLSVKDSGPGIPREDQELVFQRFQQSSNNDPSLTGTGVGLTLARELALLHQGDIQLHSEPGDGATFTVHFPITEQAYAAHQVAEGTTPSEQITSLEVTETVSAPEDEKALVGNERVVLIVEDNPDLREHMAALLKDDFVTQQASNGAEGIEVARKIIPDIIISDLMMPEVDGIQLSNVLKADEKTSHVPIILLTAKADRETKLEGLQTGADDFLTKPFDNQELLTRVNNLISQRKKLQQKYARKVLLSPSEVDLKSPDEVFIQRALQVVDNHLSNSDFTVEAFQQEMGMSRMQLHRKLKGLTNFSASEFIRDLRLQRASDLLGINGMNVTEVAYGCGFNSTSYFTQCFKEKFGETPSNYHKKTA